MPSQLLEIKIFDLAPVLPGSEALPCSDDAPVDNENQNTLPNWLLAVLSEIWRGRRDWFFGVDMGIYDRRAQTKRSPVVIPDGFLSIGVQRYKRQGLGRLSHILQEERNIPPIFALEMVSQTYGGEYGRKFERYGRLGVKYYVIYNPECSHRRRHEPFEVYRLAGGRYRQESGEPYWMEEVGLGIGRVRGEVDGIEREWLAWHDWDGNPYPLPSQLSQQQREQIEQQQQQIQRKDQ